MTTSYAAKAARVSTRTIVQVKIDSDAKAAGITATKQTKPTSSAPSGRAGLSGSYTRPTTLRPRIAVPTTAGTQMQKRFDKLAARNQFIRQHPIATAKSSTNSKGLASISATIGTI